MNSSENQILWHIAGIGALGSLIAGSFCQAGHLVKLILKNNKQLLTYQQAKRIKIIHDQAFFTCSPGATTLSQLGNQPIQQLICCTKAYDISKVLMRLKNNLNENSIIILIHNGLGVLEEIQQQLPHLRIILGISKLGAYLENPFTAQTFLGNKIHLGAALGRFTPDEINHVCASFKKTILPYQWEENISICLWEKFAINSCINILTALFNCINGDLVKHQDLLKLMTQEIGQVLAAYNIPLSADDLWQQVKQIIQDTAGNYSSMYKDIQHHRKTEITYLNDQLVKLAEKKHIDIPVNKEILQRFYDKFPQQNG